MKKLPLTRKEAQENGSLFYLTDKPCKHGHYSKRYTSNKACFECLKAKWDEGNVKKRERNRANWLGYMLKKKNKHYQTLYGISFTEVRNIAMAQNYKCAICSYKERFMHEDDWMKKGFLGDLHLDHCHETGNIRGLLCKKCNMALGVLHNQRILNKAKDYLRSSYEY